MVAKINILNSFTNVVAKINIRVFKIYEQLRLKFGKKLQTASLKGGESSSQFQWFTIAKIKL